MAAVPTVIYHWLFVLSYWIGCPISPDTLSDTLLSIWTIPPFELISTAFVGLEIASFKVCAILTWLVPIPDVIA